jgi:hypothetical protein
MSLQQLTKLYEELIKAGKFIDPSTEKQAFIDNLATDNADPVVWVGSNGETGVFAETLISNGLIEAERDRHWAATEHHFIGPNGKRFNNLVRDKQRYDINKNRVPKRAYVIKAIIKEVKAVKKYSDTLINEIYFLQSPK